MPLDITKELQKTFDKAVMQYEAKSLNQGQDWQQARAIIESGEKERAVAEDKYRQEYDTRVEIVSKRLTNEAGEIGFDHPTPMGRDKFDGDAINRQAHREVRHDHERVLQQSLDNQSDKIHSLQETARQRDTPENIDKGKAKEHFGQVNDRRKVPNQRR